MKQVGADRVCLQRRRFETRLFPPPAKLGIVGCWLFAWADASYLDTQIWSDFLSLRSSYPELNRVSGCYGAVTWPPAMRLLRAHGAGLGAGPLTAESEGN